MLTKIAEQETNSLGTDSTPCSVSCARGEVPALWKHWQTADTELPLWPLVGRGENTSGFPEQHFLNKLAENANWFHRKTQVESCPTFSLNRAIQEIK